MSWPTDERLTIGVIAPAAVEGGSERMLLGVLHHAADHGLRPWVACLQDGWLPEQVRALGIPCAVHTAGRLRQPRQVLRTHRFLDEQIQAARPQVIFSNLAKGHVFAWANVRRHAIPCFWHQGGIPDPPHWLDRLATRLPAEAVMTVSAAGCRAQAKLGGPPAVLVHPGVDLDRFDAVDGAPLRREFGIPSEAVLIGIVGRLQRWKGQRVFLEAVAPVLRDHPHVHAVVVGGDIIGMEPGYEAELHDLRDRLGIADRVTFTGHSEQAAEWFAAIDIAVNASEQEPFGLVIPEAMASGCVVVATDAGGPADVIDDGETGILVAVPEPAAFEAAIRSVVTDRERRRRIGAAARARVARDFGADRMAREFADLARACARRAAEATP